MTWSPFKSDTEETETPKEVGEDTPILGPSIGRPLHNSGDTGLPQAGIQGAKPAGGGEWSPFSSGSAPSKSGALTTAPRAEVAKWSPYSGFIDGASTAFDYSTLPPTEEERLTAFNTVLTQASIGSEVSPWNTAAITSNLKLMAATPEVAFILSTPGMIEAWSASLWTSVLASWGESTIKTATHQPKGNQPIIADDPRRTVSDFETRFFNEFAGSFSSEERTFMFRLLSAMPRANEILNDTDPALAAAARRGDFWAGPKVMASAPEAVPSAINDTRDQLLAQATQWLHNNPLESMADREKFFTWMLQRGHRSIADSKALKSGFSRKAFQLVGLPVMMSTNNISDTLSGWLAPDNFIEHQPLSLGMNAAMLIGIDPSEGFKYVPLGTPAPEGRTTPNRTGLIGSALDQPFNLRDSLFAMARQGAYETISGAVDAFGQIFFDPLNIAFGFGFMLKAARTQARVGTRFESFVQALKPAGHPGLPVVNRTVVGRLLWPVFSHNIDEITDTRQAWRNWEWIAKNPSPEAIGQRFKSLEKLDTLLEFMGKETTARGVRDLARDAMQGGTLMGIEAPLLQARISAGLSSTVFHYVEKRKEWLDGGGSLQGLSHGVDQIDPYDTYRIVAQADEATAVGIRATLNVAAEGAEEIGKVSTAAGEVSIGVKVVDDQRLYTASLDGNLVGGALGGSIAVPDEALRGRGIGSAIKSLMEPEDVKLLEESDFISGGGAALLGVQPTGPAIYQRVGELTGEGSRRTVISQLGANSFLRGNLDKDTSAIVRYLLREGSEAAEDAAILLEQGRKFSDLSPEAIELIKRYGDSVGYDVMYRGGEMIPTNTGERLLIHGEDRATDITNAMDDLGPEANNMAEARLAYDQIRRAENPELWFVSDLPDVSWTKRLRATTSNNSTASWMVNLRKKGFRMTHRFPGNVSLTNTPEGSRSLHNWIKMVGGTDEMAERWADVFRKGNVGTREEIFRDAMKEAGAAIDDVGLREGLIKFEEKKTHSQFAFDRGGNDPGLALDGSVKPLMIVHQTDHIVTPDPRQLLKTIKRSKQVRGVTGSLRLPQGTPDMLRLRRGIPMGKTHAKRQLLADSYAAKYRRLNGGSLDGLTSEDFIALAYADVLGGSFGRANGMGHISQAMSMVGSAHAFLHSKFVIAQLALRPVPWSMKFLGEETVRADQFAIPSLWRNPTKYVGRIWEEANVRKLPQRLTEMARYTDELVSEMFVSGAPNWRRLEEVIPDLRKYLDTNNVDPTDIGAVRAHVSHLVGSQLEGAKVLEGTMGIRSNVTRRAFKQHRKVTNALETLDRTGRFKTFRWHEDGIGIANRSFHSGLVGELETSYMPLEWDSVRMTEKEISTFGHGYGKQMYQVINDTLYGRYGFDRAISEALGTQSVYTAERLVTDKGWQRVKHIVDSRVKGTPLEDGTQIEKAGWYLAQMDEMVHTLFDPLTTKNGIVDIDEKVRVLNGLKNHGKVTLKTGGVTHVLNAEAGNMQGLMDATGRYAKGAHAEGRELPRKIAAYLDPRYGQDTERNAFRRFSDSISRGTDSILMHTGENTTQALHRQPAFAYISEQWFNRLKAMGWEDDVARHAAGEKAVELTNYIFFDNKNIPQFLHDMNQYIPFFSAMYEVAGTWLYKIPSVNVLPVGYLSMVRRVDRTITGLRRAGLIDQDPETGQMTLNLDADATGARTGVTEAIGKTLFQAARAPVTLMEYLGGLVSVVQGEGFEKSDLGAHVKSGMSYNIGNPLDPTTSGFMAVNQFSVGGSPDLQWFMSSAANAVFAWSDEMADVPAGTTVADYMVEHPDEDIFTLMRYNQDAFVDVNTAEAVERAFNETLDITSLKMPDMLRLPESSWWETVIDKSFFPFGKIDNGFQSITAISPSALNYVWRGLFQKLGVDDDSELLGMMFGQFSNSQVTSEIFSQAQMLEATEGVFTKIASLGIELQTLMDENALEFRKNPSGDSVVTNPDHPKAAEAQALSDRIARLNFDAVKRMNDNAAGSLLVRGLLGNFAPSTPRLWEKDQLAGAEYWRTKDIATQSEVMGSNRYTELLAGRQINGLADFQEMGEMVQRWLEDPSGDAAKMWFLEQNPGLGMYLRGKTFWGPMGPPPQVEGFDAWLEQMESEDRTFFEPEVFINGYQRAGISSDREVAIITKYGNDPDIAAQRILDNGEEYNDLVDEFDMQLEAIEFLDKHLYEGRYENYRTTTLTDLTAFELADLDVRTRRQEVDNLTSLLEEQASLSPSELARINSALQSTFQAEAEAVSRQKELANRDEIWLNPREKVLSNYWDLSREFYTERSDRYAELDGAETSTERGRIYDKVRRLENEWFQSEHFIEGWDGAEVAVPSPLLRSWNNKTQGEKQESILRMVAKPAEWLNLMQANILIAESPKFNSLIPSTAADMMIYDVAGREIDRLIEYGTRFPNLVTPYETEKAVKAVKARLTEQLIATGRAGEVQYRDAQPIQQLAMGGLLPPSLSPVVPFVNQIMAELRGLEKSAGSDVARIKWLRLTDYLRDVLFVRDPQAKKDFDEIGRIMYDETSLYAIVHRLFVGSNFGELR